MVDLIINNSKIKFKGSEYDLVGFYKVDDNSILLSLSNENNLFEVRFEKEQTRINNTTCKTIDEIIELLPSNGFLIIELQNEVIKLIDNNTQKTISEGFEFDGIVFSLSPNAQLNISNIPNIIDSEFPFPYLGKNDEHYLLTLNNKMPFYYTALDKIKTIRISNGELKTQVKTLTTIKQIQNFKNQNNL